MRCLEDLEPKPWLNDVLLFRVKVVDFTEAQGLLFKEHTHVSYAIN